MARRTDTLFCDGDLSEVLRRHAEGIRGFVDAIPKDQFLAATDDDLVENVLSKVEVEPLVLLEDQIEMDSVETPIDVRGWPGRAMFFDRDDGPALVPGTGVQVHIPFQGDAALWKLRPNSWQSVFPHATVKSGKTSGGHLLISIAQPADEPSERIKNRLDEELRSIRFYIGTQKGQLDQFHSEVEPVIRSAVASRRKLLEKQLGIERMLGLPLKKNPGAPSISIPLKRKLIRPLPQPAPAGFKPEPGITVEQYEHILGVIRHEGRTFESTPKTAAKLDEEELRDFMLADLNGHYEGGASGETFRGAGKTDIRIEDQNRAAFVAECKIWYGEKELLAAIGQLLGYLTWRDCKAAIVMFNKKNVRFGDLVDKVPGIFAAHPHYKRSYPVTEPAEWRFAMALPNDQSRDVLIHVFAFNIYRP